MDDRKKEVLVELVVAVEVVVVVEYRLLTDSVMVN